MAPSAVTSSTETRLSQLKPALRLNQPIAASKGQTADTRVADEPTRSSQAMLLGGRVDL